MTILLVMAVSSVVLSGLVVYIQYIIPFDRLPQDGERDGADGA